ncbi:MAG: outer membrane lipid asymmetry maintenance protein MlaD [Neisseriaceae bacterium]|jgi:phospholipid/cholesterol/gamma-HCH transport system substrate-binding protein|nr:MAG: outer membrane lipid asymmetry maintenance protein MlaD [Neisseriaceae bacterium]
MKRITLDFWVGVFVLIGIVCTIFLSLKVANIVSFNNYNKNTYTLYADFTNIGSLKNNAPVKVSGFTVGKISDISLDPQSYQAKVTMQIDNEYKFSSDSSAEILTTGLLGEQYIGLKSGADTETLQNGETISYTSSAMILEQLIGKFMTNMSSK